MGPSQVGSRMTFQFPLRLSQCGSRAHRKAELVHPVRVEQSSVDSSETACGTDGQVGIPSEARFSWPYFSSCKKIHHHPLTPSNVSKLCLQYLEGKPGGVPCVTLRLCWSSHPFQLVYAKRSSIHTFILKMPRSIRLRGLQEFQELDRRSRFRASA